MGRAGGGSKGGKKKRKLKKTCPLAPPRSGWASQDACAVERRAGRGGDLAVSGERPRCFTGGPGWRKCELGGRACARQHRRFRFSRQRAPPNPLRWAGRGLPGGRVLRAWWQRPFGSCSCVAAVVSESVTSRKKKTKKTNPLSRLRSTHPFIHSLWGAYTLLEELLTVLVSQFSPGTRRTHRTFRRATEFRGHTYGRKKKNLDMKAKDPTRLL